MYFHYFVIISPWKRARPFIWTNLNPLHPRMLGAKFGWNWPSGSGEEDENVKSLRRLRQQQQRQRQRWQRRTTDKFWSEKLTWAFGSGELKIVFCGQVNKYCCLLFSLSWHMHRKRKHYPAWLTTGKTYGLKIKKYYRLCSALEGARYNPDT